MAEQLYPIALTQLADVRCIVVGGGEVATRKARALLECGAHLRILSPVLDAELTAWAAEGRLEHLARPYQPGDLQDAWLVIAATDRPEVNAAVAAEARQRRILCNVADDPAAGNFHTLAAVRSGDVLLAVSTGGESPALAALIRRKLQASFGPEYGLLAHRLGELRRELGQHLSPERRAQLWRALATDETLGWLRSGDTARLELYIRQLIAQLAHD